MCNSAEKQGLGEECESGEGTHDPDSDSDFAYKAIRFLSWRGGSGIRRHLPRSLTGPYSHKGQWGWVIIGIEYPVACALSRLVCLSSSWRRSIRMLNSSCHILEMTYRNTKKHYWSKGKRYHESAPKVPPKLALLREIHSQTQQILPIPDVVAKANARTRKLLPYREINRVFPVDSARQISFLSINNDVTGTAKSPCVIVYGVQRGNGLAYPLVLSLRSSPRGWTFHRGAPRLKKMGREECSARRRRGKHGTLDLVPKSYGITIPNRFNCSIHLFVPILLGEPSFAPLADMPRVGKNKVALLWLHS